MRARGIAGGHETQEPGREDEGPIVAMDYANLKLDGTENDDDEDDKNTQKQLAILVANDVKTGTYGALFSLVRCSGLVYEHDPKECCCLHRAMRESMGSHIKGGVTIKCP